ncbi:MAG: FHA domain-containing protein [Clostridium sp.]|nr:FHA domain-containing protein [Clostridium sp.]
MRQFMIENQGIQTFLVCKLADEEIIDEVGYETVHGSQVPGILPTFLVTNETERMLKFNISSRISLEHFFSGVMNRTGFLSAFTSIVHTLKKSQEYMIDERYFLLDSQYIFVNVGTREAELMCIPVLHTEESVDIASFLKGIVFQTQFDPSENANYVAQIICYLNDRENFCITGLLDELEKIIEEEPSLKLFYEGRARVTTMDFAHTNQPEPVQADWTGPMQSSFRGNDVYFAETLVLNSGMLKEKQERIERPDAVGETVQKKGKRSFRELFSGKRKKEQVTREEELLVSAIEEELPISFQERECSTYQAELGEDIPVQNLFNQAYVKRLKTNEQIMIDKQVFKLGKERTFVDYCIVDNPTVSRSHANIVFEDDEYYIIDMNSKNHTYVNGRMIPSGTKIKLIHGSRIKLSNEEFEFFLQT